MFVFTKKSHNAEGNGRQSPTASVGNRALPLPSHVTLNKLLHLPFYRSSEHIYSQRCF